MIQPVTFFQSLADDTRLRCLLLISHQSELCVCELTQATGLSQPKISRHLARLKNARILIDERRGQWVYYRLNPDLPSWCYKILQQTQISQAVCLEANLNPLLEAGETQQRQSSLCETDSSEPRQTQQGAHRHDKSRH